MEFTGNGGGVGSCPFVPLSWSIFSLAATADILFEAGTSEVQNLFGGARSK